MIARIAAIALVASTLFAAGPETWVPVRWQGGPIEVLRRGAVDPSFGEILRDWYEPRLLDLFRDTPVNCLLVTWSGGVEAAVEADQQKRVAAFVRAAHERKIAVVGVLYPGADSRRAADAALEAGLDGLALEGELANSLGVAGELRALMKGRPVIPLGGREALSSAADWPVLGTSDAVMPRVRVVSDSDVVVATPSTEPWIDSNTWLVRSVRSWARNRPFWLGNRLTKPSASDYVRAVADAEVAGGRWVVAPDDALMVALWRGEAEAWGTWRGIVKCIEFYQRQPEWRAFPPAAMLGIVRDRAGKNTFFSEENLNLINRRRIPYRVIERAELSPETVTGLQAILATDLAPPTDAERKLLTALAEKGGLVVAGPSWGRPGDRDYALHAVGTGTVAVYKEETPDPEPLAKDMLDLLGNNNLPVRLFNAPSVLTQVSRGPGGASLLVHMVNYATEPSEMMTVRALGEYRRARLFTPEAPPAELKFENVGDRIEVRIGKVAISAALLLEK
jgi:hypothetical protein